MGRIDPGKRTQRRVGARRAWDAAWAFLPWPVDLLAVVVGFFATYVRIARAAPVERVERKG